MPRMMGGYWGSGSKKSKNNKKLKDSGTDIPEHSLLTLLDSLT